MPKYQEIGGEIYVEGGPECEKCEGYGYKLMGGTEYGPYFWFDGEGNKIPCPACDGTGDGPVSQWTDAQKAKWLLENIVQPAGIYYSYGRIGFSKRPEIIAVYEHNWGPGEQLKLLGEGPDFSAALTAAVVFVAKKQ